MLLFLYLFSLFFFVYRLENCVLRYKKSLGQNDGPIVILLDNVSFHFSYDFLVMCEENDIKPIPLPRNATFVTQPLDVGTFKSLKVGLIFFITFFIF